MSISKALFGITLGLFVAGSVAASADTLYRLNADSVLELDYCLDPCACPTGTLTGSLGGVFTLEFDHSDPLFEHYRVSSAHLFGNVNTGREVILNGSGQYAIGGEVGLSQRIVLNLRLDTDGEIFHFDSGFVPVDPQHPFPSIRIRAASDQVVCTQIDLSVFAEPIDCPGDLTGDNEVGIADLALLLHHFGTEQGASLGDGDLDDDGDVDLADLSRLLSRFGSRCG